MEKNMTAFMVWIMGGLLCWTIIWSTSRIIDALQGCNP